MDSLVQSRHHLEHLLCTVIVSLFAIISFPKDLSAAINTIDSRIIAVGENVPTRRIFSYDMALDSNGNVHIVYSKPLGATTAEIYYVTRIDGIWNEKLLTSNGWIDNKSTLLLVGNNNLIHICYIKDIQNGTPESLYYRTINDGVVAGEIFVDAGTRHARMQLDDNGHPMFVRGDLQNGASKLVLLKTQDGNTWTKSFLDLPTVPKFRIADFLYTNGTYHITYGDSAYTKDVVEKIRYTPPRYHTEVFHNQHYASSQDGIQWEHHLLDSSGTWYELEFWHSLVLDQGMPVISMYKYAQYNEIYNRGTSVLLSKWDGTSWTQSIITDTTHPDTSEGMGIAMVVIGPGDYFSVWDFSPDDTHDPFIRGPRGNIIIARSRPDAYWLPRVQLDPFSLEGRARLHTDGSHLFFLGLGDYVENKLYFREVDISDFGNSQEDILNLILPALIHRTNKPSN